jgi:hypothetical protein
VALAEKRKKPVSQLAAALGERLNSNRVLPVVLVLNYRKNLLPFLKCLLHMLQLNIYQKLS